MEHKEGAGAETCTVTSPWTTGIDRTTDSPSDDLRTGKEIACVHTTQESSHFQPGLFIGCATRALLQVIRSDDAPCSLDATGFDDTDIDAERLRFHAQRIAEGFD